MFGLLLGEELDVYEFSRHTTRRERDCDVVCVIKNAYRMVRLVFVLCGLPCFTFELAVRKEYSNYAQEKRKEREVARLASCYSTDRVLV